MSIESVTNENEPRAGMEQLATLAGHGWLRTRESGSANAAYRIVIWRRSSGPEQGHLVTDGVLCSEAWALVVARLEGTAELLLDSGEAIDVRLTSLATDTAANFIIVGKMPGF
jgi:hypothetical protein